MAECVVVKFNNGDTLQARIAESRHTMDENNISCPDFGPYQIICLLLSIITYATDICFNCWLSYYYYTQGQGAYFALTVTFIVLPALVTTAFSMRWYILDGDEPTLPRPSLWKWGLRVVVLLLQLAPLLRYCDALSYGLRSRRAARCGDRPRQLECARRALDEDSDAALLRLFHCFLHAAPQAILQLTVLVSAGAKPAYAAQAVQSWAVVFSLASVAWALTSYYRSVRFVRDDKEKLSWRGAVMLFCWHLMSTASRVLALSLLASLYPAWLAGLCAVHWAVMAAWLALGQQHTAVCASRCEELLFSVVLGLAYVLAFVSPRDGPTRYAYLAYYLVFFIENTGALVVWCVSSSAGGNPVLYYGAVAAQTLAFVLALTFMLVYYRHFHPTGTSVSLTKSVNLVAQTKPTRGRK